MIPEVDEAEEVHEAEEGEGHGEVHEAEAGEGHGEVHEAEAGEGHEVHEAEERLKEEEIEWALGLLSRFLGGQGKREWTSFFTAIKKEMCRKSLDPRTLDRLVFEPNQFTFG